jgi:adenylate cyclase class 2
MSHINVEIKALCDNADFVRQVLNDHNAVVKGLDHQIDTYFNCDNGRLKLRQGNIETSLIHYKRDDQSGPKRSNVTMLRTNVDDAKQLKLVLIASNGVKVVVDKKREIFFVDNVKFHVDTVCELGNFVEIEAIDNDGTIGEAKLLEQCQQWLKKLKIEKQQLIENSYSDLLLAKVNDEKKSAQQ